MKTLSSWLSPFDPRGMSVWGTIACIILSYGLYGVQGRLVEVWPNRCSLIKSQLVQASTQELPQTDTTLAQHPLLIKSSPLSSTDQANYWLIKSVLNQQNTSWLIPKGNYQEAKVRFNRLKPIWVELVNKAGPNLTLIYESEQSPIELYKYLMQAKGLKEAQNLLEKQTVSRLSLEKLAFEKTPSDLSCHREVMDEELHVLVALLLKSTELGLTSVQALEPGLWLSTRQVAKRQHYRIKTWLSSPTSPPLTTEGGFWSLSWSKDLSQVTSSRLKQATHDKVATGDRAPKWLIQLLEVLAKAEDSSASLTTQLKSLAPEVKLFE